MLSQRDYRKFSFRKSKADKPRKGPEVFRGKPGRIKFQRLRSQRSDKGKSLLWLALILGAVLYLMHILTR